ncbi:ABC transporter substrate-binding protein [Streptomyces collinus]
MPLLPKTPSLSRRTLLRGLGGSAALGTLAGCGVPAAYVAPGDRAATDRSATERRLTWANWPLYIDTDDKRPSRRPTLEAFEKETGISVDYIEEINDNDEFFGKISPSLMNHQPTDRDLIVISDWMCGRFVRLGWVQEMDRSHQPNVTEYLDPLLRSPAFDPGRKFTVPWQSGITGIAYNRRRLGREIRHVSDLWAESLMIPDLARHKANAERLIDHYYRPEVAAELAAWVNYVCPVPAAQDVLASSDDEERAALAEDPLIFPDAAMRERLAIARDISAGERAEFAKRWNGIVGV